MIQVLVEPGGERTMVPDRGANAHWTEADVAEGLVAGADLLHVVGYVLLDDGSRAGALQAMALCRAHGVPISLDPSSHGPLQRLGAAGFWSLVGDVTVLLPNRAEARMLTGQGEVVAAADCPPGACAGRGNQARPRWLPGKRRRAALAAAGATDCGRECDRGRRCLQCRFSGSLAGDRRSGGCLSGRGHAWFARGQPADHALTAASVWMPPLSVARSA